MSGKDFIKKLMKAGWTLQRVNGSHYIMRKDNMSVSVPVHSNRDLSPGVLNSLLKESGYK